MALDNGGTDQEEDPQNQDQAGMPGGGTTADQGTQLNGPPGAGQAAGPNGGLNVGDTYASGGWATGAPVTGWTGSGLGGLVTGGIQNFVAMLDKLTGGNVNSGQNSPGFGGGGNQDNGPGFEGAGGGGTSGGGGGGATPTASTPSTFNAGFNDWTRTIGSRFGYGAPSPTMSPMAGVVRANAAPPVNPVSLSSTNPDILARMIQALKLGGLPTSQS